jgi:uroporphyrin-III C-methyltransferase/precorrin-2 dehydrogenase/sirohydrochlorin ferrochelatase
VAHEFVVVSGHLPPGDPASLVDWPALARLRGTLTILMGLGNLEAIVAALTGYGRHPDTPAAVIQEGATARQRTVRATLATICLDVRANGLRPPALIVVGDVVEVLTGVQTPPPFPPI